MAPYGLEEFQRKMSDMDRKKAMDMRTLSKDGVPGPSARASHRASTWAWLGVNDWWVFV